MTSTAGTDFATIIAAGGSGQRFASANANNGNKPKQFLELKGLPLYAWSLLAFSKHHLISRFVMVVPSHMVNRVATEAKEICITHNIRQSVSVIAGGASRQESVFQGLKSLATEQNPPVYVLVHDAARPLIDPKTVDLTVRKAIEYGACTVGTRVSDTIKRVSGGKVVETIPRDDLVAVQTPQAARFTHLLRAHEEAALANYATTDDAALLEWAGHDVYIVEGPASNIKVTHSADLMLAEALGDFLFNDRL